MVVEELDGEDKARIKGGVLQVSRKELSGLADAPLLAAAANEVMFVIESGKTRTRAAIEALNRLEATGAHVLGATLTKSTDASGGYGYKRYGYGYGYGRLDQRRKEEILMIPQDADG